MPSDAPMALWSFFSPTPTVIDCAHSICRDADVKILWHPQLSIVPADRSYCDIITVLMTVSDSFSRVSPFSTARTAFGRLATALCFHDFYYYTRIREPQSSVSTKIVILSR
jgi:hypothetical protein